MVYYCVAFGCKNEQDHRRISFHGFPFKRPEILQLWIKASRRENWTPTKYSKLCGEHFLPTDYVVKPGCTVKLLKPDAVPTVFAYPKHLSPKIDEPLENNKQEPSEVTEVIKEEGEDENSELWSALTFEPKPIASHCGPQTDSAERHMTSAFGQLTNILPRIQTEPPPQPREDDDCDLYGKLLAIKLRELPPDERKLFMYDIDALFVRRIREKLISH